MIDVEDPTTLVGLDLLDRDGQRLGQIDEIYLDDVTARPKWAAIAGQAPGSRATFVPLELAEDIQGAVKVAFTAEQVRSAPRLEDRDGHLDPAEEAELYRYYDLVATDARMAGTSDTTERDADPVATSSGTGTGTDTGTETGAVTSTVTGTGTGTETGKAMTVSEERLEVGTRMVPYARARLRRFVVTEEQTVVVPVRTEKAVLEVYPVNEAGEQIGEAVRVEDVDEVTLSEERVLVTTETVPVQRVRIVTQLEQGQETVTDQVRRERVEVEGDVEVQGRSEETHRG